MTTPIEIRLLEIAIDVDVYVKLPAVSEMRCRRKCFYEYRLSRDHGRGTVSLRLIPSGEVIKRIAPEQNV